MNNDSSPQDRYARHRPLLSPAGMEQLQSAGVLVAGVGGLGSNVTMLLARLGVGRLVLRDPGVLDAPDLNRQNLYHPEHLGRPKIEVAVERLLEINPDIEIDAVVERISPQSSFPPVDITMDCLDSFAARAALEQALQNNPAAAQQPLIHGGAEGWFGQVSTVVPAEGGYAGLFGPGFAERSAEASQGKPIMPHVVALVAAAQVQEFVRWCDGGKAAMLLNRILVIDGMAHQHEIIELKQP